MEPTGLRASWSGFANARLQRWPNKGLMHCRGRLHKPRVHIWMSSRAYRDPPMGLADPSKRQSTRSSRRQLSATCFTPD